MANPGLNQFTHSILWMLLPATVLAGLADLMPKKRRRRAKRSGSSSNKSGWADDLVLAPWWISLGLGVAALFILPGLLPAPFRPICVPLALLLFFICGISALRKCKTGRMLDGQTSLESIMELSSKRFEDLLGEAYRRQGYQVTETLGGGPDGGVDVVLGRDGYLILVQAKRWKNRPVPVQIVRELYGVMAARGAAAGKLVTTSNFTPEAKAFAEGKAIELVGANGLLRLIRSVQTSPSIAVVPEGPPHVTPDLDYAVPVCPRCRSAMVMRTAKKGLNAGSHFYGCPNYPRCRGTRAA